MHWLLSRLFCGCDSRENKVQTNQQQESHSWYKSSTVLKAKHRITSTEELLPGQMLDYFRDILFTEFPQYTVRENVAVTELAGDANDSFQLYETRPYQAYKAEWGQPYSFVLYMNGDVKGVVMLGDKESGSNIKYLIARVYAKKLNIPYINFYTSMPNEILYVVDRINKFLK